MKRRDILTGLGGVAFAALTGKFWAITANAENTVGKEKFEVQMSEDDWKKKLKPEQYNVLREHGTERAFTSPLNDEKRPGLFKCAGCGTELFATDTKFNSGTGWPSFYAPLSENSVGTTTDFKIGYPRTEVHCAKCGGHLGHVFDDGPKPTGKRYCMNGVAMTFDPKDQ